jgi:hypothetical protein
MDARQRRHFRRAVARRAEKLLLAAMPNTMQIPPRESGRLNFGDSVGFICLLIAVISVIITPPFWLKVPLLLLSAIGFFVFTRKSHWTHQWHWFYQTGSAFLIVVILGVVAVPQLATQWRNEHPTPPNVGPRITSGPEPFKAIPDRQLGQMAIDEADKIEEYALVCSGGDYGKMYKKDLQNFDYLFRSDYLPDVLLLHDELLKRLGPGAKELNAESTLKWVQVVVNDPDICRRVGEIFPYLRRLGIALVQLNKVR